VGYGAENSTSKWNVSEYLTYKTALNAVLQVIMGLISSLLQDTQLPEGVAEIFLESSLLPFLEGQLRGGSLMEMEKDSKFLKTLLRVIERMINHPQLHVCLRKVDPRYQPKQLQSLQELVSQLA
jgi:hypothetical protein